MGNLKAAVLVLFASSMALVCSVHATCQDSTVFYWGADRGRYIGSDTVELMLNKSGGTGIKSNVFYMYGSISFSIKLPSGNSAGTVATFYLSSYGDTHDEIDFEFLGNVTNEPYTIHTNVYTQGYGKREIQFKPWFDPTDGYHTYTIFWNLYEVVWMVDGKPIRVYRKHQGYDYPDAQPMKAYASFWNADDWATQKGRVKTDWSLAPFKAMVQNYKDDACKCTQNDQSCVDRCSVKNENNWWTKEKYQKISPTQKQEMDRIRANYMIYDFCADPKRFNGTVPQECSLAQY